MAYSTEAFMEWAEYVGLAVCGATVKVRGSGLNDYACQLEPGHDGPHDPR